MIGPVTLVASTINFLICLIGGVVVVVCHHEAKLNDTTSVIDDIDDRYYSISPCACVSIFLKSSHLDLNLPFNLRCSQEFLPGRRRVV
jgi:hypothetical protein